VQRLTFSGVRPQRDQPPGRGAAARSNAEQGRWGFRPERGKDQRAPSRGAVSACAQPSAWVACLGARLALPVRSERGGRSGGVCVCRRLLLIKSSRVCCGRRPPRTGSAHRLPRYGHRQVVWLVHLPFFFCLSQFCVCFYLALGVQLVTLFCWLWGWWNVRCGVFCILLLKIVYVLLKVTCVIWELVVGIFFVNGMGLYCTKQYSTSSYYTKTPEENRKLHTHTRTHRSPCTPLHWPPQSLTAPSTQAEWHPPAITEA
jgi:hypothetical protein